MHLSIQHRLFRFQLKNAQNIPGCGINAMKGCTFFVEKIDPIKFKVQDGPNCQSGKYSRPLNINICVVNKTYSLVCTFLKFIWIKLEVFCVVGEEFHYQLENEFIFVDETNSSRGSGTKRVLKLPPRIPPRSILKVKYL